MTRHPARRHGSPLRLAAPGFTLVELLVVIGIIALLISILLPSLSAAREQAKMIQCLSNLKQIGQASITYASRYQNFTVPGYAHPTIVVAGQTTNKADAENYATMLVNEKLLPAPNAASIDASIATDPSVFQCPSGSTDLGASQFTTASGFNPAPSDRKDGLGAQPWRVESLSTGVIVDTWYGCNCTLDTFATNKEPCRRIPEGQTGSKVLNKVTQIHDSTRMVFLYDGTFLNPHYDGDRIHARHMKSKFTNILFFDGHAASFETASLPGGMGPNAAGTDIFTTAKLGANPELCWRMDQR